MLSLLHRSSIMADSSRDCSWWEPSWTVPLESVNITTKVIMYCLLAILLQCHDLGLLTFSGSKCS
jgi:hypothetical protein